MSPDGLIPAFVFSAAATFALLIPTRAVLRRAAVVDQPNVRSSHQAPTIRGAGIALVIVVAAWAGVVAIKFPAVWILVAALLMLAVVSFLDDLRGLSPVIRLVVQIVAAGAAIAAVVKVNAGWPMVSPLPLTFAIVAWCWVTGYTNAFNFMDGINGIAASQAILTGIGTAAIAVAAGVPSDHPAVRLSVVISGAALGFLPHNFPRARVFMGDVGSASLGFLLAVSAVWIACTARGWLLLWIALLHANFVLDSVATMTRRAIRGERIYEPHREHFYQRLVRTGKSHAFVTGMETLLQLAAVAVLVAATPTHAVTRICVAGGLIAMWSAFFWYAEHAYHAAVSGER